MKAKPRKPIVSVCGHLLARHIKSGELKNNFTIKEVLRKKWPGLQDAALIESACAELCQLLWLKRQESSPTGVFYEVHWLPPGAKEAWLRHLKSLEE